MMFGRNAADPLLNSRFSLFSDNSIQFHFAGANGIVQDNCISAERTEEDPECYLEESAANPILCEKKTAFPGWKCI